MSKRKISIIAILAIILIISLTGCDNIRKDPDKVDEKKVYTGTEGLAMQFMKDLPPSKIYDASTLIIVTEVENKGTSDLSGSKCIAHLHGFDDNIIRGIDADKYCGKNLWEKSISYPEGGRDTVEFSSDKLDLPKSVDSLPQKFILTACYEYETIASPIVCIDPQLYKIKAIEDACTVRDVSLSGGQGAPVSINTVEVDMISENKVGFTIHISNVGGGTVLRPGVSLTNCLSNLDYDDYNIIDYDVDMTSGSMIDCSPEKVRLVNDRASIYCTFRISGESAYTTPLEINLDYNYLDSISKDVEIVNTPE